VHSPPPVPGASRSWSRRGLLASGLALATSACTLSDPAVRGTGPTAVPPRTTSASPSPSPNGAAVASVPVELALAARAASVEAGLERPTGAAAALVDLVHRTHLARAALLAAPSPATPGPTPRPPSAAPTRDRDPLVAAERKAAGRYRRAALAVAGPTALLLGSMSVAGYRFAQALDADEPPRVGSLAELPAVARVSDTRAVAAMVTALHAVVYGYQQALGRLATGSDDHDRALAALRSRRALDQLSDVLTTAGADVPAASPAYAVTPRPTSERTAGLLVRHLERGLLPFCGVWLAAAARADDRALALDTLAATAAAAESWGAPLLPWPGYQTPR